MGKDIVIQECEQPGGHSRLWNYEDVNHVLIIETGTEKVEGILLVMPWSYYLELCSTAFIKMCNLIFLKLEVWNKSLTAISMQLSAVKTLNDSNFDDWKESLSMYLAIAQLDLALRVDAPTELTDESIIAPVLSSEKLSKAQCPQDDKERTEMENIPYGSGYYTKSLKDKQIKTFTDEELHKGEEISPELLKIIQESSVSIVIFSENYADSPWCLDELVEILKCKEESGQIVLPVFYKVDPTDVQKLTGNFEKAFAIAMHGEKGNSQKVDNWKHALMEVSNLSGWDLQNMKYESKLVEEIVNDVLEKFSYMPKNDDSYDRNLIGIESRVEKVEWLLNDKQVMGIWGMGGTCKTTIAQEVFRRNKNKFDGHCFVENVRETMTK
ncbi:putative disease resistance protein At4g11170 [Hevea brasiliensis]|uniref:putative disease resistance protein At4g11170 n=1 Tax=Hevea brasiliensis TaxID=3981 RepID=UPI0025D81E39|nr:putative disease resistance protein At4g11170 [Hevea brasiliensis]